MFARLAQDSPSSTWHGPALGLLSGRVSRFGFRVPRMEFVRLKLGPCPRVATSRSSKMCGNGCCVYHRNMFLRVRVWDGWCQHDFNLTAGGFATHCFLVLLPKPCKFGGRKVPSGGLEALGGGPLAFCMGGMARQLVIVFGGTAGKSDRWRGSQRGPIPIMVHAIIFYFFSPFHFHSMPGCRVAGAF